MGRTPVFRASDAPTASDRLCFIEYLETCLAVSPPRQKGLRTRERLKISTAQLLRNKGFHALKVSDITSLAGVAEGSFYMYFRDKTDATRTVLEEFIGSYAPAMMRPSVPRSPFQSICETNRRWIALARANAGLFRCLLQFTDGDPAFARLVEGGNRDWYMRVLNSLPGLSQPDRPVYLLMIYLLGAMMDDLLRKLVVYPDQQFRALLDSIGASDHDVVDAASVLWMRALHGTSPDTSHLSPTVQAAAAILHGHPPPPELGQGTGHRD
ncbi:MAG: TetR/AcrR family transcriptional regulator [Sandaracinobacter sp.]